MDATHDRRHRSISGILNKAVAKWQAQPTTYKTKAQFITDFNKYYKEYRKKIATTTPIAHNVQQTNAEIGELCSIIHDQNTIINPIIERVDNSALERNNGEPTKGDPNMS